MANLPLHCKDLHDPNYRWDGVEQWYGPLETYFDWLTLWMGKMEHHRVVLMSEENADAMRVALETLHHCRRAEP